jgi:chromate transporter
VTLLRLFYEFFKTGLFSVGGGLATIPFLRDMGVRTGWFTDAQLTTMIAVSESTPGPMGINMATYAGMTAYGIPGAVLATFSLVLPSLIIIIIIARVLEKFRSSRLVNDAFCGLRPASVGLVAAACAQVLSVALLHTDAAQWTAWFNWKGIGVFVVLMALYLWKKKWHPIVFVALGAVAGIALGM